MNKRETAPNLLRRRLLNSLITPVALMPFMSACSDAGSTDSQVASSEAGSNQTALASVNPTPELQTASVQQASTLAVASDFRTALHTPTQITKLNGRYFIVDCWHHRIIHSNNLHLPFNEWQALDEDIAGPHSIATDGTCYVAEDTGRHGLKVYHESAPGRFEQSQYLENIGKRPHRTLFDAKRQQFLTIGSGDQRLYILKAVGGQSSVSGANTSLSHTGQSTRPPRVEVTSVVDIPELHGQYCRSITLQGDLLYFVGNEDIVIYQMTDTPPRFSGKVYTLTEQLRGSNDLYFLEGQYGIFTSTPFKAFLFNSLDELVAGQAQDISKHFPGTPYYVSQFDDRLWITEITGPTSAIRSYANTKPYLDFDSTEILYHSEQASAASRERELALPR